MQKVTILLVCFLVRLGWSASSWQARHYEVTDNGFTDAAALDSLIGMLCGIRDDVGVILYKTTDGGTTWQETNPWTIEQAVIGLSLDFVNQNTGYMTALGLLFGLLPAGVLYKTTNGGATWTNVYGLDFNFLGIVWEDVFFVDLNNGWLAGRNSDIRRTTNGGSTWTTQTAPVSGPLKSIYFINATEGWIVGGDYDTLTGQAKDGLILHTTNGGTNWTAQIANAPYNLWGVHFIDNLNGWACGYKDSVLPVFLRTTNGGNNWAEIMAPSVSIGHYSLFAIEFTDAQNGFSVGGGNRQNWQGSYFGAFLKTIDGGSNWVVDTVIYENDPWGLSPLGMDMFNSRWGYAGGTRLSAFRYTPLNVAIDEQEFFASDKEILATIFSSQQKIVFNISNSQNYKKAEVYDVLGRKIFEKQLINTQILSLPNLVRGCYFLKLYHTNGAILSKKFIVT